MKTKIQLFVVFLLLAVGALWLTSCSSEDAVQGSGNKADATLTLTINTGKVGSRATNWTTDPGSDKANSENKINRLTVGVFSSDGNTVKTIVELTPTSESNPSGTYLQGNKAYIVTTSLADNDKVLVAVNAPTGKFAGVSNATAFKAVQEDAKDALTDGSSEATEIATNVPMFGESTLTGTGSVFTTTVSVQHQLAKITLDDLSVAFDANGPYKDAEFTPTEFFLVNVPTTLAFNNDAWVSTAAHLHGCDVTNTYTSLATSVNSSAWGTYKPYLSTGQLTSSALTSSSASFNSKAFFYAVPNANDATAAKNMKLIIAGTFKTNSSDAGTTVFYPVALNANYAADGTPSAATNGGAEVFKVYPNKNYKCTVVIKTKGTTDPTKNLDPQTATVTVTVTDFVEAKQTTTFE